MTGSTPGRPYVDQPVADAEGARHLADVAADGWGLPSPRLLRASMNHVFVAGDTVVRVGIPNGDGLAQIALAENLADLGLSGPEPARPEVVVDSGLTASAWRRVAHAGAVDWEAVGVGLRVLHSATAESPVPSGYPVADPRRLPWWSFDALLGELDGDIDGGALQGMRECLDRHAGWDDWNGVELVLCHGDVHPGNVVAGSAAPVILDWDLMCLAPPEWDLAPMGVWSRNWGGEQAWFQALQTGYGDALDGGRLAAFGDLRDLAATLMAVRAGRRDPRRASEARRRLAFWRDGHGPRWTSA